MAMHIRRREFIVALGGAVTGTLAARAQQDERTRRIGVIMGFAEDDAVWQPYLAAFRQRLQEFGWSEGRNLSIECRWAAGDANRMTVYAAELVAMRPAVVLVNSPQITMILLKQTRTVPIVFVQVTDPVGSGIVPNLAKPGGNVTGFASFQPEMGSKWLEILKEIAPGVARVAIVLDPQFIGYIAISQVIETVAPSFGVRSTVVRIPDAADIEEPINEFAREPNGGLIVLPSPATAMRRRSIIAAAAQNRMPAIYPYRYFSAAGGLIAYSVETVDHYRRAAFYVDRILKGEKPGNLPVQQPVKFELVINLAAAKAIGINVPTKLLARADEVIQ